jgi:hypothetical protein
MVRMAEREFSGRIKPNHFNNLIERSVDNFTNIAHTAQQKTKKMAVFRRFQRAVRTMA